MTTAAQWRKLALSMPEAEEKSHFEQPDFRVRNKIFAGLSRDGEEGTLKLGPDVQAMVMAARADAFYPASGAWGRGGWTHVRLARVEIAELKELMVEAWGLVAPKTLVSAAAGGAAAARKKASAKPSKRAVKRRPT
jgi:hypothetical protein